MPMQTEQLQDLYDQQRQYVNHFFDHLDLSKVEQILTLCLECKGLLIWTGVGKSGIIAEKIAMTLISTGTRALYLPTLNFLHGDIGGVREEDIVMLLSKSGQTQELLELIPHLRRKGCKIVAVVSEVDGALAKAADHCVLLPVEKELCPFDLAPTTSTAIQLLFGDLLAMALMRQKNFSLEDYAGNHPSGAIGRKITLTVRDLMKTGGDLPICRKGDRLVDVIVELSDKKCGCLLVVDGAMGLEGIFTDGDLRRALQVSGAQTLDKTMEELMSSHPICVHPDLLAIDALRTMQAKRYVTMTPVVENKRLVGLLRMHDIIHQGIEK
jgi:arabinose-5-phosphate isomerase